MGKGNKYTIKTRELIIEPVNTEDIWEGDWTITLLLERPVIIGKASFRGEKQLGAVPLRVELNEGYRNKGYGTEIFKLLVRFAFGFKNIYVVDAVTEMDNDKCIYAMEKAGFVYRKTHEGMVDYSIIKQKSTWLGIYMYMGLLLGLVLVVILGGSWVGLIIGLVLGFTMGTILENQERRAREKVLGRRE